MPSSNGIALQLNKENANYADYSVKAKTYNDLNYIIRNQSQTCIPNRENEGLKRSSALVKQFIVIRLFISHNHWQNGTTSPVQT